MHRDVLTSSVVLLSHKRVLRIRYNCHSPLHSVSTLTNS